MIIWPTVTNIITLIVFGAWRLSLRVSWAIGRPRDLGRRDVVFQKYQKRICVILELSYSIIEQVTDIIL